MSRADEQSLVRVELDSSGALRVCANISKREYFAAMALQGIMANSIPGSHHVPSETVKQAVERADALIAELEKKD